MDGNKFDKLTVALATGTTRRAAIKGAAAGALGGVLGLLHRSGSSLASSHKIGICHQTGSATNPLVYLEVGSASAAEAHAAHGDATYVDLSSDLNNCGACGVVCTSPDACNTAVCTDGECGTVPVDCDDGDACTTDSCDPAIGCVHEAVNCDDGDACTTDSCDPASGCFHEKVVCEDDGNVCTNQYCDPDEGCVTEYNTDPCTTDDGDDGTCLDGVCVLNPDPGCAGATCDTFIPCGPGGSCVCGTLASGGGLCVPGDTSCGALPTCGAGFTCAEGSLCFVDSCCGRPVCYPLDVAARCDEGARLSSSSLDDGGDGGPTFGGQ